MAKEMIAMLLAGGQGSRLYALTEKLAKPAVPFGGKYRIIDFKRNKFNIQGKVAAIEYDPYRNCRIALIHYVDGEKRYIIQPSGLKVGDVVFSASSGLDIKTGFAMKLKSMPIGTIVHNIEMHPGAFQYYAQSFQ